MDFLGLLWVASFFNNDFAAMSALVWPDFYLSQPTNSFLSNHSVSGIGTVNTTATGALVKNQTTRFNSSSQAFFPFQSADWVEPHRALSLSNLLWQPSQSLANGLSLSRSTAVLGPPQIVGQSIVPGLATSVLPAGMSWWIEREVPTTLLPNGNIGEDSHSLTFASQLPSLSQHALDWSVWNSVANVSVIKVAADSKTDTDIAFLKTGQQCLALSSALEPQQAKSKTASKKPRYQIWVHDVPIGEVRTAETAYQIATKLRRLIQVDALQPAGFKPLLGDSFAAGRHNSEILFVVDQSMMPHAKTNPALVASQWINNLRVAFGEDPMKLVDVQMIAYGLKETNRRIKGTASWYGPYFHGRKTATGEIFNQHELTAAHPSLPFGTYLKVHNLLNGKSIIVRVNDRGPYVGERSLDLSYAAAQCLGSEKVGVIPYEATILKPGIPARWEGSLLAGLSR
ncbi:MAG TPA: septal ring lytic transglycosylase RlpA family protein [Leptolyngbyaceae cyanobacterium]